MTEPAVLYELATEPEVVDLTIAAAAIACRTSYTAVARAVAAYEAGEREPVGTPGHLASLVWRGIQEYRELVGDGSHSARV